MKLERAISPTLVSSALFLSMIAAHLIGGGSFEFNFLLPAILIGTFVLLYVKKVNELTGPQLAALILLFQFFGHMTISAHAMNSNLQMSASHVIAGIAGFHVVRRCQRCIERVEQKFISFFIPQIFRAIDFPILRQSQCAGDAVASINSTFKAAIRDRAPPSLATYSIEITPS